MNKKILISLSVIGVVAAIAVGGTIAYFSDTETSTGNTFTAGVIDISVDGENPWTKTYTLADMKPSQTDYINFTIENKGSGANPVNVWKTINVTKQETGAQSEPECTEQGGCWDNTAKACDWHSTGCTGTDNNNIASVIDYDLSVEVFNADNAKIWWQTIYNKDVTVAEINGQPIFLGMVPANGSMKVTQSYHMKGEETGNWAQGDVMTFNIEVKGEQLKGELVLENKSGDPNWQILGNDTMKGTLAYNVKGPKFDYSFTASGLEAGDYQLIYYPDPWTSSKQVVLIGNVMTASGGSINVSDSVELGMDLPNSVPGFDDNFPDGAKIWLVPTSSLSGTTLSWTNTDKFLFETALITYDDTDL